MLTKLQEERQEKAEARADRFKAEAERNAQAAHNSIKHIPPGQPILVGHHSEQHHRRDLACHDRYANRAVEAYKAAKQAAWSAGNAGRAITSDDPEAVPALEAKIANLEAERDQAKEINRLFRRGGWNAVAEAGLVSPEGVERLKKIMELAPYIKKPFETYHFSNLSANIRRYKERLEQLRAAAERPEAEPVEGDGFRVEEDKGDCRIRFYFDKRPDRETCRLMRSKGFKFSRENLAWQRLLNDAGRRACLEVAREVFGYEG